MSLSVWLLVYDSESNCDRLEGVYTSRDKAIAVAINFNKQITHDDGFYQCEAGECDCERIRKVDRLDTKCMSWGPGIAVGFYYVIEMPLL